MGLCGGEEERVLRIAEGGWCREVRRRGGAGEGERRKEDEGGGEVEEMEAVEVVEVVE